MSEKITKIGFENPRGGIKYIFEWANKLWLPSNEVSIEIDFSRFTFVKPFEVVFILDQISLYMERFPATKLLFSGLENNEKAKNIGISAILQKEKYETPIEKEFILPVRRLSLAEFRGEGVSPTANHEAIEHQSGILAKHLTMSETGAVYDATQFALREIIRNIFEHSGSKTLTYAATYSPRSNIAEICVSDQGSGIHSTLTFNKKFEHLTPKEALEWACLPGVSGNPQVYEQESSPSPWRNSGYGLYMMNRLCRNKGDFLILSNQEVLYMQTKKNNFKVIQNKGTTIRLHLNLENITSLKDDLSRYAREGKEHALEIRGAARIEASKASTMLRRDFD